MIMIKGISFISHITDHGHGTPKLGVLITRPGLLNKASNLAYILNLESSKLTFIYIMLLLLIIIIINLVLSNNHNKHNNI